jgi:hypothetical protein
MSESASIFAATMALICAVGAIVFFIVRGSPLVLFVAWLLTVGGLLALATLI